MQAEVVPKQEAGSELLGQLQDISESKEEGKGLFPVHSLHVCPSLTKLVDPGNASEKTSVSQNGTAQFPPPKTDKPRPHVCNTCGRSFARLEHLKRHERSHTKEKPFECPECTRCFARRDLLLRHQQKLHLINPTSAKPRGGRRESVGGTSTTGANRVRKNSVANNATSGSNAVASSQIRPRANTISHLDVSSLGLMDMSNPAFNRMNALGLNIGNGTGVSTGMSGFPGSMAMDYRGMSTAVGSHGNMHGLAKINTHAINGMNIANPLHTAPAVASYGGFDIDQLFSPGTTVNPAQLHFGSPTNNLQHNMLAPIPPYVGSHITMDDQADFGWMHDWNIHNQNTWENENAIDESSPSRVSSGDSPDDFHDRTCSSNVSLQQPHLTQWPQQDMHFQAPLSAGPFQMDVLGNGLPNLDPTMGLVSPNAVLDPNIPNDQYFQQAAMLQNLQPLVGQERRQSMHVEAPQLIQQYVSSAPPSNNSSDSPGMSSSSMNESARHSSITTGSTDSITDATRQALLTSLAQPSVFGGKHRKYSQPSISSPLSPGAARGSVQGLNLPSTNDIRRYVEAFIQFAHPHVPVMHIPTLNFDSLDFSSTIRGLNAHSNLAQNNIMGGGGCLILAAAAMGALYEYEHVASKELFEAGKKLIGLYLEERRKADMSAAVNGAQASAEPTHHTPLWLVQAMLLNVIYGHQCGDKTSADIASNHCAALVSLARAAGLMQPPNDSSPGSNSAGDEHAGSGDVTMTDDSSINTASAQVTEVDLHTQWLEWKDSEERKRTLFAIFIISSLLTTAYNQTPTIMNSEILSDLPCDEQLWSAESAQAWQALGGAAVAEQNSVTFAHAMSTLLTAKQRQRSPQTPGIGSNNALNTLQADDMYGDGELRPSTFGCLVLINALHNYIWETRSRHCGRQWTAQETESMFSHIEPALNAWLTAWKANDRHKLERPNPFGLGPLSADSIPLLDLAFVRLFVNLGRTKEAFWQRDFDAMADELARGSDIVQHAGGSPQEIQGGGLSERKSIAQRRVSQIGEQASTRRERHLRKAAFYAADSLSMACSYNLTYADVTAHELPVQSAMCFFDCSQVLAEWACTVQERVGRYLGVLGRDRIEMSVVPAIMLLEGEDTNLIRKIESICESMEVKRYQQENLLALDLQQLNPAAPMHATHNNVSLTTCGYGSRILRITAMMLEKAVVWPGMCFSFLPPSSMLVLTIRSYARHGEGPGGTGQPYGSTCHALYYQPITDHDLLVIASTLIC
jgi:hypothetical protein